MSSLQFVQQVDATPLVKKWNYIRVEQAEPQMSWYITPFTWWGCIACFQRIRKIALGTCYKATALWLKPKPCVGAFNARSPLEMASSIFHQSGINIQHSTGSALKEKMHNSLKCILSVATHKGQRYDEINKAIHKTYNYGHLVIFHISYQSCVLCIFSFNKSVSDINNASVLINSPTLLSNRREFNLCTRAFCWIVSPSAIFTINSHSVIIITRQLSVGIVRKYRCKVSSVLEL